MGLFDDVRFECDLGFDDPKHAELHFQTKSLNCAMDRYTVDKDGLLKNDYADYTRYNGTILIYDFDEEDEWVEYNIGFVNGRVRSIIRENKWKEYEI
jgi:hypothetical protein